MPFLCDAADFDGTNDNLRLAADLTGIADGKAGTFSGWVRLDGGDGAARVILTLRNAQTTPVGFQCSRNASNKLVITAQNSSASSILSLITTPTFTAGATWIHILCSWDLAATTAQLYINDAAPALDTNTITDDTIEYTRGLVGVGGTTDGAQRLNGCLAEIFFHTTYIDLSVEANRRKFISATGKPVNLGADGSTPLGVQPLLYLHLDDGEAVANFAVNAGSGGDFTVVGTLDTGSTSPSDGQEPVADFSGTPLSGTAPLGVQFTDLTTNDPTSWSWDFGDSGTSTDQNPLHSYLAAGTYTVALTATSNAGSDAETKIGYVTVTASAQVGAGGGEVRRRHRTERSWDKWWKKEHAKREAEKKRLQKKKDAVEKKVEKLEQKVKEARRELTLAKTLAAIRDLRLELERLQKLLDKEQEYLEELEMQEIALLWMALDDAS